MRYGVILVHSTSHAMWAERLLKIAQIPCRMVPVPRHLSSDCGVCVRVTDTQLTSAFELVRVKGVGVEAMHQL
ncbi:MAG: DUF3343 domain-containing protein [Caldilineaceae bacterium]|nr:DUF3343 domain-containing protein [Caldilineaceae bacterium]